MALLVIFTFSSGSRADEAPRAAPDGTQTTARALFEEARALLAAEKYAEACPKLAESFRLDAGAGTEINLGHCYEKNGQLASAWTTFKDAVTTARRAGRLEWAARAERRAELLEPQLPMLTLRVPAPSAADGLELRRNGVVLAASTWGSALPLDPGIYRIEASAPSRRPWVHELAIEPAAHITLDIPQLEAEPTPPRAEPHTEPEVPPRSPQTQRTVGIVTAAVGVAGIGVGIATGIYAISANREVDRKCPTGTCPDGDTANLSRNAVTAGNVSTVSLIAGGTLGTLGAILFIAAPRRDAPSVRPAITALPGGGALFMAGIF